MSAIENDAPTEFEPRELTELSEDGAAAELLRRFLPPKPDAKKPSDEEKGENKDESTDPKPKPDDKPSAEEPEGETEGEDEGEEDAEPEAEHVVKIKVGDEEHEVKVSQLTRLYGQEAALTKKSMEVAEQRKTADSQLQTNAAATSALLQRAQARFEPYSKLDFNLLAAQIGREGGISAEDYQSLRQSAQAAHDDVQFLEKHLGDFGRALQERAVGDMRQKATECLKVLTGPTDKGGIEGWDQTLYGEIRNFAVAKGVPVETVNAMVEPWAFHLLNSAMMYERGKSKGVVKTVKQPKQPTKITKTSTSPQANRRDEGSSPKAQKLTQKLSTTGNIDDAAELMMERWRVAEGSKE